MTRSASAASATRAGVYPRISPSTSSGSDGSVSSHSSLTARNAGSVTVRWAPPSACLSFALT
jgi:hypothetical protein